MAKRLFFVSAAILMLAIAYHLGYQNAQAQAPGVCTFVSGSFKVGDQLWDLGGLGWSPHIETNGLPPVPVSSIIWLGHPFAVTDAGEGWYDGAGGWQSLGFISGGTVNVQPESWTGVKEKYRK